MKQEDINRHLGDTKQFLSSELARLRTGRATTAMVEDILVEAYAGSPLLPIRELATIASPDPQSLLITPWDKSILEKIETAILKSNKGLNPVNEGSDIRVPVPALTEETRKEMAKEVGAYVEQAKIRARNIRQDAMKSIEEQEENGVISEDDMFRLKKQVEETISKTNTELEEMGKTKTAEIMKV
jgi:ribosome recycling factor